MFVAFSFSMDNGAMSFRELLGADADVGVVVSPCTKICVIEPDDGLCAGCARTLDEIATWGVLSPEARRSIMVALPLRRAPPEKFA